VFDASPPPQPLLVRLCSLVGPWRSVSRFWAARPLVGFSFHCWGLPDRLLYFCFGFLGLEDWRSGSVWECVRRFLSRPVFFLFVFSLGFFWAWGGGGQCSYYFVHFCWLNFWFLCSAGALFFSFLLVGGGGGSPTGFLLWARTGVSV